MAFVPIVLSPSPEPWFLRELQIIDRDLRLVWGYERYLMRNWVIERKIPPERYALMYASFLKESGPRYLDQPIYDTDQHLYNEQGEEMGFPIIGYRKFDLAPDWEWVATVQGPHGEFKQPGDDDLLALKRQYAWNRNHAYSRERYEEEQRLKDEKAEAEQKQKRHDLWMESYDEALLDAGHRVTTGAT